MTLLGLKVSDEEPRKEARTYVEDGINLLIGKEPRTAGLAQNSQS